LTDKNRAAFEAEVIKRFQESGYLEVQIRVECLGRSGDGYQDGSVDAYWHFWNEGRADIKALRKDAERYRHLKSDAAKAGSLIERLDCNVATKNWDEAIDANMPKGDQS
jgi:hypothetical protein